MSKVIGIVKEIIGTIKVTTQSGAVKSLSKGDVVHENDKIDAMASSQVIIQLNDGKEIIIEGDTSLSLNEEYINSYTSEVTLTDTNNDIAEVEALLANDEEGTAAGQENTGQEGGLSNAYYHERLKFGENTNELENTQFNRTTSIIAEDNNTVNFNEQNLDDTSEIGVGPVTDADTDANSVGENAANGTEVQITGLATDPDAADSVTYSLSDDYNGAFTIDPTTGVVTVLDNSKLDYETNTAPTIEITATSSDGSSSKETFTINLSDDTSEIGVGPVTDADTDANSVGENAANGTEVQITGLATDPDAADSVTYSLSDDYNGAFTIDPTTGVVTVLDNSKLDYETNTAPTIEITATSSDGSSSKETFTINLSDDTNPVFEDENGTPVDSYSFNYNENSEDATLIGTVYTDEDTTYTISGADSSWFEVDADGKVTLTAAGVAAASNDFEDADGNNVHQVVITATDTAGNSSNITVNLNEQNLDEAPVAVDDPVIVMGGLHVDYYGSSSQLSSIADVERIIASKEEADAVFVSTDINYGYTDINSDGKYNNDERSTILTGNLSDGLDIQNSEVNDSHLSDFIKNDNGSLVYNQTSIDNGSLESATDGILHITGMLNIQNSGNYTFKVNSDDGFDIRIDGVSVLSLNRNTGVVPSQKEIFLEEGSHNVEIVYWDQGGAYIFDLDLLDNSGTNVWIPVNLSHAKTGSIDVRDDSIIKLDLAQNDYDVDSEVNLDSIVIVTSASHGQVIVNDDGTVTYNPDDNYHGIDTFEYTIKDEAGNVSNVATVTVNVVPSTSSNAIVYEAGLSDGTDPSANVVTEGNLLGDQGGSILSVEGNSTIENGIITTTTQNGTIEVYTQAIDGHEIGDYIYTLTAPSSDGDNVVDNIDYTFTQGSNSVQSSTLGINIVDDAPVGKDIIENLQSTSSNTQTTNLIVVLDKSGSMDWDVDGNKTGESDFDSSKVRMDIAKDALKSMFDSYDNMGNVNIQFVSFSSTAEKSKWFVDNKNDANEHLDNINTGGGTYYDTALNEVIDNYSAPQSDKTLVYFISDGEPNTNHGVDDTVSYDGKNGESAWEQFLEDNNVDISFSIGITNNTNLNSLKPIAFPENIDNVDEPYVIKVINPEDLEKTLLDTVDQAVVEGTASVLMSSGETGIVLGADGGRISSIQLGSETYNYDSNNVEQTINTSRGGKLVVDFDTGGYRYTINPKDTIEGEQEIFTITAVDEDGDSVSVDLVINLDFIAKIDANRDTVLTNENTLEISDVSDTALVANDNGLNTVSSKSNIISLSENDFSSNWTVTNGINQNNNSKETATTIQRSFFGDESGSHASNVNQSGPSAAYISSIAQNGEEDWLNISLAKGEKLFFDIDNASYNVNIKVFDKDGNHLADISENSAGPYGDFEAVSSGEYFISIEFDSSYRTGDYELYMTIDNADAEYTNLSEYTIGDVNDPNGHDSAFVDIKHQSGDTVQGTSNDEILIGRDNQADTLNGAGGNDIIVYDSLDTINGGDGRDILLLDESISLDFDSVSNKIDQVEGINLEQGNQSITLDVQDIIDITDSENILEISGDSNDNVTLDASEGAWTMIETVDGFNKYTATDSDGNEATILIEQDIHVDPS